MVQLNLKKHSTRETQYVPNDDILCQWEFNEQIEKLIRLLF